MKKYSKNYCRLCKKYVYSLSDHLREYHAMTIEEYLIILPSKEIESESLNIYSHISMKSKYLKMAIYKAHDGKCFYTGKFVDFKTMHMDHLVPKNKGGKDCIANLVLTSSFVNRSKRDKELDDTEELKKINIEVYAPKVLEALLKSDSFLDARANSGGKRRYNPDKLIYKYTRILDEPQNDIQAQFLKQLHSIKGNNGKPDSIAKLEWLEELYIAWKEKQT